MRKLDDDDGDDDDDDDDGDDDDGDADDDDDDGGWIMVDHLSESESPLPCSNHTLAPCSCFIINISG